MRFSVTEHSDGRTVFRASMFDHLIGKKIPLKVNGVRHENAAAIEAKVSDDRRAAEITLETEDGTVSDAIRDGYLQYYSGASSILETHSVVLTAEPLEPIC